MFKKIRHTCPKTRFFNIKSESKAILLSQIMTKQAITAQQTSASFFNQSLVNHHRQPKIRQLKLILRIKLLTPPPQCYY